MIDIFFASRLVQRCQTVEGGLPASIISQMWLNVAIDFLVGLVPFVGDLMDAVFRCNTKNVALLEKHLKEKYGPKDKVARDRSGLEAFSDDSDSPFHDDAGPPQYQDAAGGTGARQQHTQTKSSAPQGTTPMAANSNNGGGWFSGWGRRMPNDMERGQQTGSIRV